MSEKAIAIIGGIVVTVFVAFAGLLLLSQSAQAAPTVCPIANGCTGTGNAPSYGQLLVGNSSSGYTLTATSSLGILGTFSTTSAAYWFTQQTTSGLAEGSNQYFTNARSDARFVVDLAGTSSVKSITTLPSLSLPYSQITSVPNFDTWAYPFPASATSSLLTFTGGILDNSASTTINGNATTTGTFYSNIASSSSLFGAGLASCSGTNALTWSAGLFGCAAEPQGTVTSIAGNNGLTGTVTSSGNIGLATINAGVLGSATSGAVPTSQATSTLYGAGVPGQVLGWSNGALTFVATSTGGGSQNIAGVLGTGNDAAGKSLLDLGPLKLSTIYATSTATSTLANDNTVLWVPWDFATNGCAGDPTKTEYGACVNALYAKVVASGSYAGNIWVPDMVVTASQWTTEVNFSGPAIISYDCVEGATLIYGGTGTSTLFNMANPTGHLVSNDYGCLYQGNTSLIAAGNSNSKTTTGVAFGGSNGAPGVDFHDNSVNGFGRDLQVGQHAYMVKIENNSISGGNGGLKGDLIFVDKADDSGEALDMEGNNWTDPGNNVASNDVYISDGSSASTIINGGSLDDAQIYFGSSDGLVAISNLHVENASCGSGFAAYIPFQGVSSDQYTMLDLDNIEIANDCSGATSFQTIVQHGGQEYAKTIHIDNYGGGTIATFSDHSLDNGLESEQICGIQVAGGGLTNIIGGSGAQPYTQAIGAGCTTDVGNSYVYSNYIDGNNLIHFTNGGGDVGTADSNGNWTFQTSATIGSLNGLIGGHSGLLYAVASSSLFGYTPLNPTRNINTTWPLQGGGNLSADRTLTFGGLSTSTAAVIGNVPYFSGPNTFANEATGTITCTGTVSCGSTSYVLGANLTITGSGGGGSAYPFPLAGNATSSPLMLLASTTIGNGNAAGGLTVSGTATTTKLVIGSLNGILSAVNGAVGTVGLSSDFSLSGNTLSLGANSVGVNTNNGLTGGGSVSLGNSETLGLANINANSVLANNTSASAVPTSISTTTLFGALGTPGQVLMSSNGGVVWAATSTSAGAGSVGNWFTPAAGWNSTSTLLLLTKGIMATATSTIGDGTRAGGLTISGSATTTNTFFVVPNGGTAAQPFMVIGSTTGDSTHTVDIDEPASTVQNVVSLNRSNNGQNNFLQFEPNGANTTSNVNWILGTPASTDNFSLSLWDGASVKTQMTISDTGAISNKNGDVLTEQASYVVSTSTVTGDFTDVQSAINALPTGQGGTIHVRCGVYTLPSGNVGIQIKSASTTIEGEGNCTEFNYNEANTNNAIEAANQGLGNIQLKNFYIHQTNNTFGGIGVNASNTPLLVVDHLKIDGTATATQAKDTANLTFYQNWTNLDLRGNTSCVELGGNPVNDNTYTNIRCAPQSGNNGFAYYLDSSSVNGAQNNTFINADSEPTGSGTGITAIYENNAVNNTWINPYMEGNGVGYKFTANSQRTLVEGGTFVSNTTYSDAGSNDQFLSVSKESQALNQIMASSTIQDNTGNDAAINDLSFRGNTNFAKTGNMLDMVFANSTDSGNGIHIVNPGTGFSIKVDSGTTTLTKLALTALNTRTTGNALCINTAGNEVVTAGNTTCSTSSKYTKQDIVPLPDNLGVEGVDALAETMKLQVVQFQYKETPDVTHYGLIAEDVEKIDPNLVEHAATTTIIDGHTFLPGDPIALDTDHLAAGLLVKDIQQLQGEITALGGGGIQTTTRSAEENYQWEYMAFLTLILFGYIGYNERRRKE